MSCSALTTAAFVRDQAERWGDNPVLVTPSGGLTYAGLELESAALSARLIGAGVGKGTWVGILCRNGIEWLVSWAAATRIGAVAVLLSTYSTPTELSRLLAHADVTILLTAPAEGRHAYLERLEEAVPALRTAVAGTLWAPEMPALRVVWAWPGESPARQWVTDIEATDPAAITASMGEAMEAAVHPSDPSTVIYTSGSTSAPKGVVHSHAALLRHSERSMRRSRPVGPVDRVYSPNPFFWIGGLGVTILGTMHGGAALLAEPTFEAGSTLDFLERERATLFLGQPHAWRILQEHPSFASRDLAAMKPSRVGRGLAMTETCSAHAATDPARPPEDPTCFGRAVEGIEHRVVDPATGAPVGEWTEGELCVRGQDMMLGMVRRTREEVFDADGWYHTGDLGMLGGGEVYFRGRLDDRIRSRGTNVFPRELELELQEIEGVAQAVVVGLPSTEHGQDVAVAVVAAPGVVLSLDDVRSRMRARLSAYKVPSHVRVLDRVELPLTATGKVDRARVRALFVGPS